MLNIIDQSYSGTYSEYFVTRSMFGMDTVRKRLVYVKSGIKKLHTIGRLDYVRPFKKRMAKPIVNQNATNNFDFDGRTLVPQDVDIYEEINPRSFEKNQVSEILSETIIDREVPQTLQSQLVQLVLDRAGEQNEIGLWQGSTDYQALADEEDPRFQIQWFDGYLKRMVEDAGINLSSISPVTITTSNISTILDDLLTQATEKQKALVTSPDTFQIMKFIVSPKTAQIYTQYLRTGATFKGNPFNTGYIPPWGGYDVESVAGMADNTILFLKATDEAKTAQLWVGMNSTRDWQLKVAKTAAADETFFIQGKFKFDVNYGWSEEIFMYTTLTEADFQLP